MKKVKKTNDQPKMKYRYVCPACTNNAIFTSSKMIGNKVTCQSCGKEIILENMNNYIKI